MKSSSIYRLILLFCLVCAITTCGISESKGEQAAKEVISAFNSGNPELAKQLMDKYEGELEGEDYLDYSEAILEYFN